VIPYDPITGDVWAGAIKTKPRTCFIMTQLGEPILDGVKETRRVVTGCLKYNNFYETDASYLTTGRDFLIKIWGIILSVPLGIAIICEGMQASTLENIYFELGVMQALGKETILIKVGDIECATDLIRTEFIEAPDIDKKINSFLSTCIAQAGHYEVIATELKEKNPLLALDYMKRAFMITKKQAYKRELLQIVFDSSFFDKCVQDEVKTLFM
jgi:hypothetical protein